MGIKIQNYNRQVSQTTPRAPSVPNPGAVRGAFGEDVYRANQEIGQTVSNIGDALYKHGIEQQKLKNDSFVADQDSKADLASKQALNDPEKGYLNRMGLNSSGSLNEFNKWSNDYKTSVLKDIKDPTVRDRVAQKIDSHFTSAQDKIISHEASETRKGRVSYIKSDRDLKIADAYSIGDSAALNDRISQIQSLQHQINTYEGLDSQTSQLSYNANAKKTVEKAINGAVAKDPSGAQAYDLLEGVKQNLQEEDYNELKKKVGTDSKKIASDNQIKLKQMQTANEAGLINDFIGGKINVADQENIKTLYQNGKIGEEFGKSMIKAMTKPISADEFDDDGNDQSFIDLASWALETKEPSKRNELVTNILNGFNDDKLSQRNMALLVQTAMKQQQDGINQRKVRNGFNTAINTALKVSQSENLIAKDYLTAINQGKSPEDSLKVVMDSLGVKTDDKGQSQEGTVPSKFGVSDKLPPEKGEGIKGFLTDLLKVDGPFQNGVIANIASTPQILGSMIKEYGEAPEQNRNFWNDILTIGTLNPIKQFEDFMSSTPALKKKKQEFKDDAVKLGDDLINKNVEWIAQQGLERPEGKNLDSVLYDLGSGAGSVGVAVGVAVVSKNPVAIAAMFGAMGKAHMYQEARAAGKSPEESTKISNVAGMADFGLQMVGLNFMLKNYGGRLLNAGVRAAVLGGQTGAQSVTKDVLSPWQEKEAAAIAKDAAYNAMIGVLLGFGTSAIVDMAVKDGTVKKFQEIEAKTEFGKELQQQMRDKQNIPLHPAEEGKSEVERLYGKKDIEGKLKLVEVIEGIKKEVDPVMSEFEQELAAFENEGGATKTADQVKSERVAKEQQDANLDQNLQSQAEGEGMTVREAKIAGDEAKQGGVSIEKSSGDINMQDTKDSNSPLNYKTAEDYADGIIDAEEGRDYRDLGIEPKNIAISEFGEKGIFQLNEDQKIDNDGISNWEERIKKGERPAVIVGSRGFGFPKVIDGHHRLLAYKKLGFKEIPTIFRSDLTDKWEAAHRNFNEKKSPKSGQVESTVIEADGLEGTGDTKQRGLSKSVEQDAIHKKLVEDLGDLPTYQTRDMKDVAKKVEALINKDPELAKRIALGDAPEQDGVRSQELFSGLKVKAEIEGDVNMLRDLAMSDKATALATELGQRVKAYDSNSPDSPVDAIREVKKAREEVAKKKLKTDNIAAEKKKIAKEIQKEAKKTAPTKETWESFVRSVQC